jgi:hypothetical protein
MCMAYLSVVQQSHMSHADGHLQAHADGHLQAHMGLKRARAAADNF